MELMVIHHSAIAYYFQSPVIPYWRAADLSE